MGAVALAYGVALYFTQYLSWYGTWSLYEQHAFLLPVPLIPPPRFHMLRYHGVLAAHANATSRAMKSSGSNKTACVPFRQARLNRSRTRPSGASSRRS